MVYSPAVAGFFVYRHLGLAGFFVFPYLSLHSSLSISYATIRVYSPFFSPN